MQPRMLVIDDEESILFAMREYFSGYGYSVDCATEHEEAETFLANGSYSVVIADLRLSGVTRAEGLDLVAYARQRCRSTRVILLTAYGSPEIEQEARRRGVDAFLHKPKPLADVAQVVFGLMECAP